MKRIFAACFIVLTLCSALAAQPDIPPTAKGDQLIAILKDKFRPETVLSYRDARQKMFSSVDNKDGIVRLVYTGQTIRTNSTPNHNFVNTEHLWPQSRFGSTDRGRQKADLYHLRPTFNRVNSERGNKPFGEIEDSLAEKWWNDSRFVRDKPLQNAEDFSESTDDTFEPREDFKGDVARSLFYFATIYDLTDSDFFNKQKETLLAWHQLDPIDGSEKQRNDKIELIQGNRNPYVDDSLLVFRAFAPDRPIDEFVDDEDDSDTDRLSNGDQIEICTWNLEFFYDADTSDNRSDLAIEQSADSEEEFTKRLKFFANGIKRMGLPSVVALQEVENGKVVEQLAEELNSQHGANYKVAFVQGNDTFTEQDVAFLFEDKGLDVIAKRMEGDFDNRNLYKIPSKHCVLTVSKRAQNGTTKKLSIITCHLKAGRGSANETKRMKQARVINHFSRDLMNADSDQGIIVLGDMNASKESQCASRRDAMGVLAGLETLGPEDDFLDLNTELDEDAHATHVSGRELDRVFINGALLDDVGLVYEQIRVRKDIVSSRQTDHFPVIATFTYIEE